MLGKDESLRLEHPPEAFFAAQTLFQVKVAMLVAVTCFLIEPLEFTVAIKGANLVLVQSDAVALERIPERSTIGHSSGERRKETGNYSGTTRLANAAWLLKGPLFPQQRL